MSILKLPSRRVLAVGLAMVLSLSLGACTTSSSSSSSLIAAWRAANAAGLATKYVKVATVASSNGTTYQLSEWAGPSKGIQELSSGSDQAKLEYVGGVLYARATMGFLERLFVEPASLAAANANKWGIVSKTNPGYHAALSGVSIENLMVGLAPIPNNDVHTGSTNTYLGVKVNSYDETVAQSSTSVGGEVTYFVAVSAPHLPVAERFSSGSSQTTDTFSQWGVPFPVVAPHVVVQIT